MDRQGELDIIRAAYARQILAAAGVDRRPCRRPPSARSAARIFSVLRPWPIIRFSRGDYMLDAGRGPRLPLHRRSGRHPARAPLNNGQPSLHAHLIHQASPAAGDHVVHIGTGTGYYTAILAHLAGPTGRVTGIEYDPEFAARAKANLAPYPTVAIVRATALWFHSTRPTSSTSMQAARGRPTTGSIALPTADG